MTRIATLALAAALIIPLAAAGSPVAAQGSATLRRAGQAYGNLSYSEAIILARQASRER